MLLPFADAKLLQYQSIEISKSTVSIHRNLEIYPY